MPAMWTSVALAALVSAPAQPAGGLELKNVRLTIGEHGPARPNNKLLPGDVLFIAFDIEGMTVGDDGALKFVMAMEVTDAAGKPVIKQDPREVADFVPLRGSRVPARVFVTLGLDMEAGMYSCRVTVTDPAKKTSGNLTTKFEVIKRDFGIVAVYCSYDDAGSIMAPTTGQVGQTLVVQFTTASFKRDPKTKQPNVEFEFNVLDEKGQPTLLKPAKHTQNAGVPEDKEAFGMRFPMFLTRPGKFTFTVKATDKVGNKTATYSLPITSVPPAN
jgi:hypothetical protein